MADERIPRIVAGESAASQAAIEARARRAATGLVALGVRPGDTVALLLHNDVVVFEAGRAAALAGAIAVPLDRQMALDDLLFILADCAARALIAHADLLGPLRGRLPPGLAVVAAPTPAFVRAPVTPEGSEPLWPAWSDSFAPQAGEPPGPVPSLGYTSGSTGRPKCVRREASGAGGSAKARRVYGFDEPGPAVALVTGPLSHSVPRAFAKLALAARADLVLMPRFEAEDALALIARHGVTHVHLSPAMMIRLLRLPEAVRKRHETVSLRHVVHGAAPCPPAIKAEAIAAWGPIVHEYYGSTETGLLTLADSDEAQRRPGTVGRALEGITLGVFDDAGRAVATGERGTIYAGSVSLHRFTYLGRAADRAAIGRGDLVTAGDIGHLDADGYLYLHDRGRNLIEAADGTVVPAELEAAILGQAGVADCAVFDLPGGGGSIVVACVEPLPGVSLDAGRLATALAAGGGRRPDRIAIVDALPRSDTGKIFKDVLRARLRQGEGPSESSPRR